MIIIKISILYFIQITHTDDLSSTGSRLVLIIYQQEQASMVWQCHEERGRVNADGGDEVKYEGK